MGKPPGICRRCAGSVTFALVSDLDRLRQEYADRARRFAADDRYTLTNQTNLFTIQQRQRDLVNVLHHHDLLPLSGKRVLEMGCGNGGVLLEWLQYGVRPNNLHGVELLPARLAHTRRILPQLPLVLADGRHMAYPDRAFDIVLQFTVLSSILDRTIQQQLAREMVRVLKPGGVIISYDFWLNPTNKQTVGMTPRVLHALFADCDLTFCRVTLAPPIARRLVPLSWITAAWLEKLKLFNSHFLVVIRPKTTPATSANVHNGTA